MRKTNFLSTVVLGLVLSAGSAYAHGDAAKPAHGGQMGSAGALDLELVVAKDSKEARDNPIVVYVTDHAGKNIATAGATGSATFLAGKDKATTALVPDGDNRMKGSAKYASVAELKAIISVTLAGKTAEQARFTPLAAAADGHTDHTH